LLPFITSELIIPLAENVLIPPILLVFSGSILDAGKDCAFTSKIVTDIGRSNNKNIPNVTDILPEIFIYAYVII
jgi:hypothetical protein